MRARVPKLFAILLIAAATPAAAALPELSVDEANMTTNAMQFMYVLQQCGYGQYLGEKADMLNTFLRNHRNGRGQIALGEEQAAAQLSFMILVDKAGGKARLCARTGRSLSTQSGQVRQAVAAMWAAIQKAHKAAKTPGH